MGGNAGGVFSFVSLYPVDSGCLVSGRETDVTTRTWSGEPVTRATKRSECAGVHGIGFYERGACFTGKSGMALLSTGV